MPAPVVTTSASPVATDGVGAAFGATGSEEPQAWRSLAGWGASLDPGEPGALAPQQSLACFRGRDGLGLIRQLNRPGIVKLVDERGRTARVLLSGLGAEPAPCTSAAPTTQCHWPRPHVRGARGMPCSATRRPVASPAHSRRGRYHDATSVSNREPRPRAAR